jgi:hypothetical protein
LRPSARLALAALLAAGVAGRAAAWDPFPGRTGGSGILDVPVAEVPNVGAVKLSGAFAAERDAAAAMRLAPLPLSLVVGSGPRSEVGFGIRQGGGPGDPTPSPALLSASAKWWWREAVRRRPAVAFQLYGDRLNWKGTLGLRAVASTIPVGKVQLAGFAGVDNTGFGGVGVGGSLALNEKVTGIGQLLVQGGGYGAGAGVRWKVGPNAGAFMGLDYTDAALRFAVGFAVATPPPKRPGKMRQQAEEVVPVEPAKPRFLDDGPRFRMRITPGDDGGPGHEQYEQPPAQGTSIRASRTAHAPQQKATRREARP